MDGRVTVLRKEGRRQERGKIALQAMMEIPYCKDRKAFHHGWGMLMLSRSSSIGGTPKI